ncbi:hypothetical protein LTR53_007107 [Teratosphaeriaceae sp. CCFEE 6253]|nr:hypothetical protein LTR53_007107 [Teratosphaeriaceae sp. CCFEE 6253]
MNARSLRRLAADHSALHSQPLPPGYLFPPSSNTDDDLTQLDILLAGPSHTPFAGGLFRLHLTIPPTYPQAPPTAHFRTPIFHPNVEPQTGGVCVETLKRDWDAKLTLRDIMVVISCLLIQPNPDSALNAEAGALIQEDYAAFERRAKLMTGIHAQVPRDMREAVEEARSRGQVVEDEEAKLEDKVDVRGFAGEPAAPPRRRRLGGTARQRGTVGRRSEGSPSGVPARRGGGRPFTLQTLGDDIFGEHALRESLGSTTDSVPDVDQENDDEIRSPVKSRTPKAATPRRPQGESVPLGEMEMDDAYSDSDEDMEVEYPPSPHKSPSKSARKPPRAHLDRPESSRDAMRRAAPNITPPSNLFDQPLAEGSPFSTIDPTPSPRKARMQRAISPGRGLKTKLGAGLSVTMPIAGGGVVKTRSRSSSEEKREERSRKADLHVKLWESCGQDIRRWNRGDFDGRPFKVKAARW